MPVVCLHIEIVIGSTGVINTDIQLGELSLLVRIFSGNQKATAAIRFDIESIGLLFAGRQVVE